MEKVYFDSSVLLAILFSEAKAEEASKIWGTHSEKVSSILLESECLIGIRRYAARAGSKAPAGWMEGRLDFLRRSLAGVTAKEVDPDILSILHRESSLADCGTLDAIHLATALHFRERSDEPFFLVSFDSKMRETAAKLRLEVLPVH